MRVIFNLIGILFIALVLSTFVENEESVEIIESSTSTEEVEICDLDVTDILYSTNIKFRLKNSNFWCPAKFVETNCTGKVNIRVRDLCDDSFIKTNPNSFTVICTPTVEIQEKVCEIIHYNQLKDASSCFSASLVDSLNINAATHFQEIITKDNAFIDSNIIKVILKKMNDDTKLKIIRKQPPKITSKGGEIFHES